LAHHLILSQTGHLLGDGSPMAFQKSTEIQLLAPIMILSFTEIREKGRSPGLLLTPFGATVYGSLQSAIKSTNNSYILYQGLK